MQTEPKELANFPLTLEPITGWNAVDKDVIERIFTSCSASGSMQKPPVSNRDSFLSQGGTCCFMPAIIVKLTRTFYVSSCSRPAIFFIFFFFEYLNT